MKKLKIIIYSLIIIGIFLIIHLIYPTFLPSKLKNDIDILFINPFNNWYLIFEFIGLMVLLIFILYFGIHFFGSFGKIHDTKSQYFPNISILIPSKNERTLLLQTLNSIINGEYPINKIQLIIIISGSTDDSGEYCDKFVKSHGEIDVKIISEPIPKKGKPTALNYGLKFIKHDICVFYDSGVILETDTLIHLIAPFKDSSINVSIGPVLVKNWKKNKWTKAGVIDYSMVSGGGILSEVKNRLGSSCYVFGRNFSIRTQILNRYNGFNEDSLTEDLYLSVLLNLDGIKVYFIPKAKAYDTIPYILANIKKQRIRWIVGLKEDMKNLMHLKKGKKSAASIMISRSLTLMLLANIDVWMIVMFVILIICWLLNEFYLVLYLFIIIIFSLGYIINGIRKYGDRHYSVLFWLPFSIYVHLYMLTRNFALPKNVEWYRTQINIDENNI
ncbi:MAG: glycosyltransferase [Candidatus Helarchaeota archaeon]